MNSVINLYDTFKLKSQYVQTGRHFQKRDSVFAICCFKGKVAMVPHGSHGTHVSTWYKHTWYIISTNEFQIGPWFSLLYMCACIEVFKFYSKKVSPQSQCGIWLDINYMAAQLSCGSELSFRWNVSIKQDLLWP